MYVGAYNLTVYINMNYTMPSDPIKCAKLFLNLNQKGLFMTRKIHYLRIVVVIALLWVCVCMNVVASETTPQLDGMLFINTLDGAVYAWSPQFTNASLVVDYGGQLDNTSGWSSVTFSDDGHYLAYVRTDSVMNWVGVSSLDRWQPLEFPIDVGFYYSHIILNWLPNNNHLVVSFVVNIPKGPRRPAMFNELLGRQLLDIRNPESGLVNWPYVCDELAVLSSTEPALDCYLDAELGGDNAFLQASVRYNFVQSEILTQFENDAIRSIPIQDFISQNWVWSEQGGLAFFDNGFDELSWSVPDKIE
jgi:hypothetical protein